MVVYYCWSLWKVTFLYKIEFWKLNFRIYDKILFKYHFVCVYSVGCVAMMVMSGGKGSMSVADKK